MAEREKSSIRGQTNEFVAGLQNPPTWIEFINRHSACAESGEASVSQGRVDFAEGVHSKSICPNFRSLTAQVVFFICDCPK